MGFLQRLRVASGSRDSRADRSVSPAPDPMAASHADRLAAAKAAGAPPPVMRRIPSTNFLGVARAPPKPQQQQPERPSSRNGRSSALPWKKRRDEFTAVPYEATAAPHAPPAARGRTPSVPTSPITTAFETAPTTPTSITRPSAASSARRPGAHLPTSSSNSSSPNGHARTPSETTVLSMSSSTFTAQSRSRRSSTASQEWRKEGGIIGTLSFERDDWGGLGGSPSASNTAIAAVVQQSHEVQKPSPSRRKYPPPANSSAMHAALTSPPLPSSKIVGMRKLGIAHQSPSLPMLGDKLDQVASQQQQQPALPASTPTSPRRDRDGEQLEEIQASEAEEERSTWRNPLRVRRGSKSSTKPEAVVRPPSPGLQRRPASQAIERPNPLRRPSSSLFYNPFQRTQSRSTITMGDLDTPSTDEGTFVVKSFRHVSGVSGIDDITTDYAAANAAAGKPSERARDQPRKSSFPTSPPAHRSRPPSAAGSTDGGQRVSVAAFRRNIRRPSSSVLLDDEDDLPLSMSRSNLQASHMRRDSSALSLSDDMSQLRVSVTSPTSPNVGAGPTSPNIGAGAAISPSGSASHSPITSTRASMDMQSGDNRQSLVIKSAHTTRRPFESRSIDATRSPKNEASPAPSPALPTRERMSSPPMSVTRALPRPQRNPQRKTSVPQLSQAAAQGSTSQDDSSQQGVRASLDDSSKAPRTYQGAYKGSLLEPVPIQVPQDRELEQMKLPPRPHELPDEVLRDSRPPSRGMVGSPSLPGVLDEPLRRFSGFWGGKAVDDDGKEEVFDPALVATNDTGLTERDRSSSYSNLNRQSLYDRLSAATNNVSNAVGSVAAIVSPPTDQTGERLYIPPVSSPKLDKTIPQSPASDRTASPVPVPPPMKEPPAPPPMVSHSSFGRVAKAIPASSSRATGWADSSSEDEREKTPPARRVLKAPTAASQAAPRAAPGGPRARATSITNKPVVPAVEVESESEEETLQTVRAKASSRSELRQPIPRSSSSSLKSALKASTQPASNPRLSTALPPSTSNWSLSTSSQSPDASPNPNSPGSGPSTRPASRLSRPASQANMRRVGSADRLAQSTERRPISRAASSDRLAHLNGAAPRSILRDSASRHSALLRNTASPASSQSGFTGDSASQQPMTPQSGGDLRRSWADGRPRASVDAAERPRPSTGMDQWAGAPQGFPYSPSMDMYAAAAQAQAYGQPNLAQIEAMKHQMQAQWMTAAQRYFDDYWERASSVSNAQTAPGGHGGGGAFQPTYGYSYQPPMPPAMPPQAYGLFPGQFPGGFPYPYGGPPQAGFPGMGGMGGMGGMPGMPMQPQVVMGSMGMPVSSGGGMFSYGGAAQSVYGGEFGPPVAPGMQQSPPPGSPGSPRRRRPSGSTELDSNTLANTNSNARRSVAMDLNGLSQQPQQQQQQQQQQQRPSSMASHSGMPSQRVVGPPPRAGGRRPLPHTHGHRTSTLAPTGRSGSPPSAWNSGSFDPAETPRPKRVTNAS